MNTIQSAVELRQATNRAQSASRFLRRRLVALQQWRKLGRSQAELDRLNDRTLTDIGFARGEIDRMRGL